MNDKELLNLLKRVKDAPEFGGGFDDAHTHAMWSRLASDLGFDPNAKSRKYTFKEYAEFLMWKIGHGVLRPAAISLSAFALVFTGWVTVVSASFDSVPGDYLYPVKLATERVQLTFTPNNSRRARLHVEFAGRRLAEISEIERSDRSGKDVRTKAAIESFTKEIQSANVALTELNVTNSNEAVDLAIVIDQKTDEYEKAMGSTGAAGQDETKEDVAGALVTVGEANTQAVDAIVQQYETQERPETRESIQKNFQDGYKDIKTSITLSHGRLAVIEKVLSDLELVEDATYVNRIAEAREALTGHDAQINKAMDLFAAGAVRGAFDLLAEIRSEVSTSEGIITELEIEISTKIAAGGSGERAGEETEVVPTDEIGSPTF